MKRTPIDLEGFGIDRDDCCLCSKERCTADCYGLPWCEEHKHRGDLLCCGYRYGWRALACHPFALGPDEYCWNVAALMGSDELVWVALSAIHLEM
jgi:hypothetical protein